MQYRLLFCSSPKLKVFAYVGLVLGLSLFAACENDQKESQNEAPTHEILCDDDNGGIRLPPEFCALVVADNLGFTRHITVNSQGHLYVTLRNRTLKLGGLLALRDTDNDGRMDEIHKVNEYPGMGVKIHQDHLYYAADEAVYRYRLDQNSLLPQEPVELLITGFPLQKNHSGKPFTIMNDELLINLGAKTNACQLEDRIPGVKGALPCLELEDHAGIWRFSLAKTGQLFQRDGQRFASGIRNAYGIDWHEKDQLLYVVQHGRDQLQELWPDIYTKQQDERLPAEELIAVKQDQSYAWPYCYFDSEKENFVLAPEYGGNGEDLGDCGQYQQPLIAFPAHFGPNDMVIYQNNAFPEHYRNGLFIAFHGKGYSTTENHYAYQVIFVPHSSLHGGKDWQVFADDFSGSSGENSDKEPEYRPTGLAVGPDGSLYIVDSVQGRIWRVFYRP